MSSTFEVIKTLGSFVGLLTGVAYFYDRLAKGRPVAHLGFKDDENKSAYIRLENSRSSSIFVREVTVTPNVFGLAEGRGIAEMRRVIAAAAGERLSFALQAGASKELFLVPRYKDGIPLELTPQRVSFRISWRRGNMTWMPQLPVSVRTSTQFVREFSVAKRVYPDLVSPSVEPLRGG